MTLIATAKDVTIHIQFCLTEHVMNDVEVS